MIKRKYLRWLAEHDMSFRKWGDGYTLHYKEDLVGGMLFTRDDGTYTLWDGDEEVRQMFTDGAENLTNTEVLVQLLVWYIVDLRKELKEQMPVKKQKKSNEKYCV